MTKAREITATDMHEVELASFASGQIVFFTCPKPSTSPSVNEDSAGLFPVAPGAGVLAVADGAGGLAGAAKASALAIGSLGAAVSRATEPEELRSLIMDGFEHANEAVLKLGIGAATTLAAVEVRDAQIRTYHAGDSSILVTGQRGKLKHLTVSHSPVSYAVEAGVMEEAEALRHEDLNIVSNFIGSKDLHISVGPLLTLAARDTVVVASDGLFDNLHSEEVSNIVRKGPLDEVGANLLNACRRRMYEPQEGDPSKPDDLTFIVFRLNTGVR